jgi:hypothetical protein
VKQQTAPLISFIRDYNLEKQHGYICFKASVHFTAEKHWFKFISPVHIITIAMKHMDVIYLLNPEIDEKKIKTMYTNNERFQYSNTRQFQITGKSKRYGFYTLSIIPINSNCDEDIIDELRAKKYN